MPIRPTLTKTACLIAFVAGLGGVAAAQSARAEAERRSSITIYNGGFAHVTETRRVELDAGQNTFVIDGLSDRLQPETVLVSADGVTVTGQAYDADLLGLQSLLQAHINREVLLRPANNGGEGQAPVPATLLSVDGAVVVEVGGRLEIIGVDDLDRVIFPSRPAHLVLAPQLTVSAQAQSPGATQIDLAYLTDGLSWQADYTGTLSADETRLELQGMATLRNQSRTSWRGAAIQLIAGDVQKVTREKSRGQLMQAMVSRVADSAESVERSGFGDLYLYQLPGRIDLKAEQTRQVTFLERRTVSVEKTYSYDMDWLQSLEQPTNVMVALEFENTETAGLGVPMPAGTVRIYGAGAARQGYFMGEDTVDHLPEGADVAVTLGRAFDVTVQPVMTRREVISRERGRPVVYEQTQGVTLRNAREAAVMVNLSQKLEDNWKVLSSSLAYDQVTGDRIAWQVPVPAGGETVVTFTVRVGELP